MKEHILISTGIYPPKIGGPAQYAKNLKEQFEAKGYQVTVKTYGVEDRLPTGIRHLYFFLRVLPSVITADKIIILDTLSVGFPTVLAGKLCGKKTLIRTGGDFLWEGYVERTGKKVMLRNFYQTEVPFFSKKEKIIFDLTKWTLKHVTHTIFSTDWQRNIFIEGYGIDKAKTSLVENFYGEKEGDEEAREKEFIASTRPLVWKNLDVLKRVFDRVQTVHPEAMLFGETLSFTDLMQKMKYSYAVILVSLGDISPNMILDAIRHNRPFICTREVGIYERIKDAGLFVDPDNETEIKQAILEFLTPEGYTRAREKVCQFNFVHTWKQIAEEFILRLEQI